MDDPRVRKERKLRLEQEHQAIDIVALRFAPDQVLAKLALCAKLYINEGPGSQNHFHNRLEKQDKAMPYRVRFFVEATRGICRVYRTNRESSYKGWRVDDFSYR